MTAKPHPIPGAIQFWDAEHGVAILSSCGTGGCVSHIGWSSDGGRTWTAARAVSGLAWPILTGPRSAWMNGLLTVDRGHTWRTARRGPYTPVSFSSPEVGWGLRASYAQAHSGISQHAAVTDDGGKTWRARANPCAHGWLTLDTISAPTAEQAWALCDGLYGAGNDAKAVWETHDRGRHWTLVNQVDFKGSSRLVGHGLSTGGYVEQIQMHAGGHGWLLEDRGPTYSTTDGGRTWTVLKVTVSGYDQVEAMSFPSDRVGFLLIRRNDPKGVVTTFSDRLLRTTDGGRRWKLIRAWREE
jgi:photosystem II stability/assembly factor-like uncharacterized protein